MKNRASWAVFAVGLLLLVGAWLLFGGNGERTPAEPAGPTVTHAEASPSRAGTPRTQAGSPGTQTGRTQAGSPGTQTGRTQGPGRATDPESGLVWIAVADLPPEAQRMLEVIDRGGPFAHAKDGSTFGNFEGILPQQRRGYYKEYTVETPGSRDRGARRIVTGDNDRIHYWTDDHYATFKRIRR